MSTLQQMTPARLDEIVKTCLAKDPDDRWQSARDVGRQLVWLTEADETVAPVTPASRSAVPWTLFAVTVVVAVVSLWALLARAPSLPVVTRMQLGVQPAERLADGLSSTPDGSLSQTAIVLTADGRTLVFSGRQDDIVQLYRRDLDQLEAVPLDGTEGAQNPFLSPDGRWVGFWASGELRKVPLEGGPAVTICETGRVFGASWGSENRIVFAREGGGLWQVSGDGGTPEPLTTLDTEKGELSHRLPQILPGGEAVLFTIRSQVLGLWDRAQVAVQHLATNEPRILIENGADARYTATGHLVYVRFATLMAAPFDIDGLELTGGSVALLDGVSQALNADTSGFDSGAAQLAISASGTLAYLSGGIVPDSERPLVWVDQEGNVEALPLEPRDFLAPRVSPDGRRVAVFTVGLDRAVWVYDLVRGGLTRLTQDASVSWAIWTPDGEHVTFSQSVTGPRNLYWRVADANREAERLTTSEYSQLPSSWSPDGDALAFIQQRDIWILPMEGDRTPRPFVQSSFIERHAEFSPDGRWIAYGSDESGTDEIYVLPYPGPGRRYQISTEGGTEPSWSPDGRQLYYVAPPAEPGQRPLMVVDIATDPDFMAGRPRVLFVGWPSSGTNPVKSYGVAPDGRFLALASNPALAAELLGREPPEPPALPTHLHVVLNWFDELQRLVPSP